MVCAVFFFFKQKTAYEMRISDWSSDVCSSDLRFVDVEPDLVRIRSITFQCERHGIFDFGVHLLFDLREIGIGDLSLADPLAKAHHAGPLFGSLELFLGNITVISAEDMTLQAVRMCFDQGRAVSSTGTSNRCGHCLIHHFGIETT